jgi:hypothetical protein
MTPRENLIAALNGETPERTPYSIYDWFLTNKDPVAVRRLTDRGLLLNRSVMNYRIEEHGTQSDWRETDAYGAPGWVLEKRTPVGAVRMGGLHGWVREHFVKTPADYQVLQWITEHSEVVPDYDGYAKAVAEIGERGLVTTGLSRTPAMIINVDWAGTEQFCADVALEVEELFALYEARKRLFLDEVRAEAAGPGRFVKCIENLTISMIGPRRYRDLLMNVYTEAFPLLHAADKRVFVHYDGATRVIADQIAVAPFDGIESLTEPPEGDMLYDACRAAWPDKVFWAHINVDCYARPPDKLAAAVREKRERAGKRGLAFEVSEDLPPNWEEAIPVVLKTLEELE